MSIQVSNNQIDGFSMNHDVSSISYSQLYTGHNGSYDAQQPKILHYGVVLDQVLLSYIVHSIESSSQYAEQITKPRQ